MSDKAYKPAPRETSLLALEALDRYIRNGLRLPGESMPETLAVRLARVARANKWVKVTRKKIT